MKRGGGKAKGNGYEISICRKLSEWLTGEQNPPVFWRTASSGAPATTLRKKGMKSNSMDGDIAGLTEEAVQITNGCFFECKSYASWNIETLICPDKKNTIADWWKKLIEESGQVGKIPVLIFKRNGSTDFVIVQDSFVDKLVGHGCKLLLHNCIRFDMATDDGVMGVSMYRFSDFWKAVDPENLKLLLSRYNDPISTILAKAAKIEW